MEEAHPFRVVAWWAAGRTGIAKSSSAFNAIHFTAPPVFGGLEGRWTPEDLLLAALASCYTTTFRAVADHSKFDYTDLQVEVDGEIKKVESGYAFSEIATRVNLTISRPQDEPRALKLLHKAEALCLVSRALSMNKKFESIVQVREPKPENDHAVASTSKAGNPR
jgi:peroxiredoxin-like protein